MIARPAKLSYRGIDIGFIEGGYVCRIPVDQIAIDADGAPDAYGPPRFEGDREGCGTDTLNHAGYPDNSDDDIPDDWHDVLVWRKADPHHPVVKNGFFVSKTSLCDERQRSELADGKFVDANQVAYMVMPQFWLDHLGVELGDLCLLWHSRIKRRVVAIVADVCPVPEPLGEISIAAAVQLGGRNVSPRTGADFPRNGQVHCCIFKRSRPRLVWPLTNAFVQSFERQLSDRAERAGIA